MTETLKRTDMIRSLLYWMLIGIFLVLQLQLHAKSLADTSKVRIAIAGLSHDHVGGFVFGRQHADAEIVGIYEPSDSLFQYYAKRYNLPASLHYHSLEEMLDKTKPQAVADFGSIAAHLPTVKACAARKIHVMVEKPLALNYKIAQEIQDLAQAAGIAVITNYETSWYPSIYKLMELTRDPNFGKIRRIIVNDGHEGPAKLGLTSAFMEWLTDPKQSGGPILDFGCYGANLSNWLLNGKVPNAVFAVAQRLEPQTYRAEDDVTIVLDYGDLTAVLQPSWKWTAGRKDMEVYGENGYAIAGNRQTLRYRLGKNNPEQTITVPDTYLPFTDGIACLAAIAKGTYKPQPYDVSTINNNVLVNQILDAARKSAEKKRVVLLKK